MNKYFLAVFLYTGFFLVGCGDSLVNPQYALKLPEMPQNWETILGEPRWQVEWLNEKGQKETATIRRMGIVEVSLPPTWASAVLAMPFWPEKGISPGMFKPAGAIFPFDVSGKTLLLSWQGGVDATFFWELAKAAGMAADATAGRAVDRMPQNFNWPRFRELFDDPSLNEEVRADPWLADWQSIAEKTVQSGFDRRRLVPETRGTLQVPVERGPWFGTSPFAAPLVFESAPIFPVRPSGDTWVSREGLLRCNTETWILLEW